MKMLRGITSALAGIVLVAGAAEAQLCMGRSMSGELGAFGNYSTTDGATMYGARLGAELPLGLGLAASYQRNTLDELPDSDFNTFGGEVSYSLPMIPLVKACPTASVSHSSLGDDQDGLSINELSGFVSFAYAVPAAPNVRIVPFAAPGFVHTRVTATLGGQESDPATETNFAVNVGVGALISQFTVHGSVNINTQEGRDPVFNIGLGYRLPLLR